MHNGKCAYSAYTRPHPLSGETASEPLRHTANRVKKFLHGTPSENGAESSTRKVGRVYAILITI